MMVPVAVSQMLTVLLEPTITCLPSGENTTEPLRILEPEYFSKILYDFHIIALVAVFHMQIVSSSEPDTIRLLSGENARCRM
jgi:hypothetical protein